DSKMNRKIFVHIFMLITVSMSQVDGQELLTIQDAVNIAVENNHGILVSRNNESVSRNNIHLGNAGMLPKIDIVASTYYNDNEIETLTGTANQSVTSNAASIQVSYNIFNGFADLYGYKKLINSGEMSSLQARATIENTIFQVSSAYFDVARAMESMKIAKEALAISNERLERAKNRSFYGQANSIDVLSAQVDLNADSVSFVNTQLTLDRAERNLNLLLNRPLDERFTVNSNVSFNREYNIEELLENGQKFNASFLIQSAQLKQSTFDQKIAVSAYMPQLNLQSSYGYNDLNDELNINLDAPDRNFQVGLSVSINLFNGFQNNIRMQNAGIEVKSQQLLMDENLKILNTELTNTWQTYKNSLYILDIQRRNLSSAELNFERTKELYNLGQVTTTQFREAQLNLIRARNDIITARFDAKLNEIELLRLSGQLI
ncbi:MAG: TolC family protein, partial [Calditrichaceae bacterium]